MKKLKTLKITMLFLLFMCIISIFAIYSKYTYQKYKEEELIQNIENQIVPKEENIIKQEIANNNENLGIIVIPSIEIKAPIKEGTTSEILKYSVGHFIETELWNGNVALASHNRGSYAHYFSRINELKNGEEIIYITNMGERRYEVIENKIIEETNVEILENTKENIITLITCVTGKKDKRQCIIGKEIN